MPDYRYLIVGGGMTADSAAQAIHEADAGAPIGVIGAEPHPPYDRPPLSQALWKGGRRVGGVGGAGRPARPPPHRPPPPRSPRRSGKASRRKRSGARRRRPGPR